LMLEPSLLLEGSSKWCFTFFSLDFGGNRHVVGDSLDDLGLEIPR
jgi:hypothetical protein